MTLARLASVLLLVLLASPSPAGAAPKRSAPPNRPNEPSPERLGLPWQRVAFTAADEAPLLGWWFPARDSATVVVLCPRRSGTKADLLPLVREFSQLGFAVFTFDYRDLAPGAPREADSLRNVVFASRWADDAMAATGEARRLAPRRHVFLYGQDIGGVAAVAAASRAPGVAEGVICEGLYRSGFEQLVRDGTAQIPGANERHRALVSTRDEPISAVPQLTAPLLVFIAAKDAVVPSRETRDVVRRSRSFIQQESLPDAGHVGAEQTPEYFERIAAFIQYVESLGPARTP